MIRTPAGFGGEDRIKRYLDYYQPSYGVMMLSAGQAFSPASLFAAGEQGAWYDPSDFTTMFQDSTGVTPVTAVEQTVGLILDKSKNGVGTNGAKRVNLLTFTEQFDNAAWTKGGVTIPATTETAPNGTATADIVNEGTSTGLHFVGQTITTTGAVNYTLVVYLKYIDLQYINLSLYSSAFSTAYAAVVFDIQNGTVFTSGAGGSPGYAVVGTPTITPVGNGWYSCSLTATSGTSFPANGFAFAAGNGTLGTSFGLPSYTGTSRTFYAWGADIRLTSEASTSPTPYQPITASWASTIPGNHASQSTPASRPVLSARVNQLLATATLSTQSVTTLAATYTLSFSGAGMVTATGTNIGVYTAGSNSLVCTAGTLTLTIVGSVTFADLRVTNDGVGLPAYQAVVTSTNYDTTGFPYYLRFDGTDDSLATATFTPGTNKVQVFAGVRKLSDAGIGKVAELFDGVGTAGIFSFNAPDAATPTYSMRSTGTGFQGATSPSSFAAPITNVTTGLGDISAPFVTLRINASQVANNTASQGGGNYNNYPLYIGSRTGTTQRYNGRLYSLIIRFGANLDAATISNTETWVNGKTMAY